jgi:osmotically-inducible protein OsmY
MVAWIDATSVSVAVKDGRVTLCGQIGSAAAKYRAEALAWVGGVTAVDAANLVTTLWLRDKMRKAPGRKPLPDLEVRNAVLAAFLQDPRLAATNPTVEVDHGLALLSGTVASLQAKAAAEQTARNTAGVWDVRNQLKVRPPNAPDDQRLKQTVEKALRRDPFIAAPLITAKVSGGVVSLGGSVQTSYQRSRAEEIVSRLRGVVKVKNLLFVEYPASPYARLAWAPDIFHHPFERNDFREPLKTDAQIRRELESRLNWDALLQEPDIKVGVKDGIATLRGTVGTYQELEAATEEALLAGARHVDNRLIVTGANEPGAKPKPLTPK